MLVPSQGTNRPDPVTQSFIGGLAVTPDGSRLFAVHVLGMLVSVVEDRHRAAHDQPARGTVHVPRLA
jgi:hypothetical protein